MLRFSLSRLRGWVYPSTAALPVGQRFPKTIGRLLVRLRTFPVKADDDEHVQMRRIAHLVATIGEGRALYARGECEYDFTMPGGAAALLADLTRPQFRVDEELAARLPRAQYLWPNWAPARRPPRAWLGLGLRISALSENDPQPDDPTLQTVAAGARLLSIEAQLRAQTLELWAMLDDADRERIRRDPTFGDAENLDDAALLHRRQETDPAYVSPGSNLRFLFDNISEATARNAGARFHLLAGVTPLGWAVALACLVAAALHKQPSSALHAARAAIESVPFDLMVSTDRDAEAPWDDLAPLASRLTQETTKHVFDATKQLDEAMGIVVESRRSEVFRLNPDPRSGLVKVDTDSGSYQFPSWRVSYAGLPGERQGGVEHKLVEERYVLRWSQTIASGRLLAIGVVQPHLATLSDLEFSDSGSPVRGTQPEVELPLVSGLGRVPPAPPAGGPQGGPNASMGSPEPPLPPPRAEPKPPMQIGAATLPTTGDPLDKIQRLQEKSWSSRRKKQRAMLGWRFFNGIWTRRIGIRYSMLASKTFQSRRASIRLGEGLSIPSGGMSQGCWRAVQNIVGGLCSEPCYAPAAHSR